MPWSIRPGLLIIVFFLLIVWFFRYEYVTKTLDDVSCVERMNRYTRDRCLLSDDVPICRKIVASSPCEK